MTGSQKKPVLVRITTLPVSMKVLLKGQLRFMKEHGFDVTMISSEGPEIKELIEQEGCPHITVPLTRKISPLKDLAALVRLISILKKLKPSIVHTHTPKAGLIGMWAAWFAGVPVRLHTIAGLPWMEYSGGMKSLLKLMERLTSLPAHAVFPNSAQQKKFLQANNIGGKKLKVLGNGSSNGIDTAFFSRNEQVIEEGQRLRINENIQPGDQVWIFVGRLVTDKGIGELLQAFEKLHQHFPQDRLWLLGEEEPLLDPLTEDQKTVISNHPAIRQWGFVQDIRAHLAASQVLVFPSYREGFPNVPLQAGAMGCSLILSDINGCNEIVEHEKDGLLVPAKDAGKLFEAMMRLRSDNDLKSKFESGIREKIIQRYGQQQLWHQIKDEYNLRLTSIERPVAE